MSVKKVKYSNWYLLQQAIEHLPLGVSIIDSNQKLVAWNPRYKNLFSYPDDLLIRGRPIGDLYRYNAERRVTSEFRSVDEIEAMVNRRIIRLIEGNPHQRVTTLKNGMTLNIIGQPMPNGGFVTSYVDVSDFTQTEKALRESEHTIRAYTDNLPAMIAYLDTNLKIRFINKAFERIMRVDREEVIGKTAKELFPPLEYELRKPFLGAALNGERQRFEVTVQRIGDPRDYEASYIPHRTREGLVEGIFVLYQDVDERNYARRELEKAYETLEARVIERTAALSTANDALASENLRRAATEYELNLAKKQEEDANRSKTRFLAAASHDLLQPLNAARLFCSSLLDRNLTGESKYLAEQLDGALTSAESLITTLLEISKLDAGALPVEMSVFNLKDLMSRLTAEFEVIAKKRRIKFHSRFRNITVETDRKLLRRILQNLLSNAFRYTKSEGKVLFAMRNCKGFIKLQIWDNGVGIHNDDQKMIFEEFKRLADTTHFDNQGLGLGLSITKRMTQLLNIPLTVQSIPGRGSVFSITLIKSKKIPIALVKAKDGISKKVTAPLNDKKLLVIDNDMAILRGMDSLLSGWGATVISATDLSTAELVLAEQNDISHCLIDYNLDGGIFGTSFIEKFGSHKTNLQFILITADRDENMQDKAKSLAVPVLQKPIKPAALRSLLTRRPLAKQLHQ